MIQLKRNKTHYFYIEYKNDQCRHNVMVPVSALLKEYGEEITSDEVLSRARCTKCGFQGNNQMRLVCVGKSALEKTAAGYTFIAASQVIVLWEVDRIHFLVKPM